jgi:hypothetical protein
MAMYQMTGLSVKYSGAPHVEIHPARSTDTRKLAHREQGNFSFTLGR